MRNLKKVIALVAVFAMLVSTVAFAQAFTDVADTDNYAEAIETLNTLGILTGDDQNNDGKMEFRPEDTITRAEVTAIISRIQGMGNASQTSTDFTDVPSSHWASGYISQAATQGIVNGYGDGTFGPDDNVKYEEIIKMLMETLGYYPFAADNGGYPTGYLAAAQRYGVLDGVVGGGVGTEAKRGMVAQLVNNAIDTPLMDKYSYGKDAEYVIYDGLTDLGSPYQSLLTRDLKLVKVTGLVAKNSYTTLTGVGTEYDADKTKEIGIEIDDTTDNRNYLNKDSKLTSYLNGTLMNVRQNDINADEFLGYAVSLYAKKDSSDKYDLISISKSDDKNETVEFTFDLFKEFKSGKLYYYRDENSSSTNTVNVADKALVVYNGAAAGEFANVRDSFFDATTGIVTNDNYSGKVVCINSKDETGYTGYDVIRIEAGVSAVVSQVASNGKVTFMNAVTAPSTGRVNSIASLDFSDDDYLINITKDGEDFDYTTLKKWDVLTILSYGKDSKVYDVEVLGESNYVDGYVTSVKESSTPQEYRLSDGNWYKMASGFYPSTTLKSGKSGRFFIDGYGKLVALDDGVAVDGGGSVTTGNYAYVINAQSEKGTWNNTSYDVRLQVLDKSGEIYEAYLASNVQFINLKDSVAKELSGWNADTDSNKANYYTDFDYSMKDLKNVSNANDLADALVNNLITYSANSAGEVKAVTFAGSSDDDDFTVAEDYSTGTKQEYDADVKSIGGISVNDDTVVFYIKADGNDKITYGNDTTYTASKTKSSVSSIASLADGKKYNYIAFDSDDSTLDVGAIVIMNEAGKVSSNGAVAVIDSVGKSTSNGDTVYTVDFYMNGEKMTATTVADMEDEEDIRDAETGDIFNLNVSGDSILGVEKVLSYKGYSDTDATAAPELSFLSTNSTDDVVYNVGLVTKVNGSKISYSEFTSNGINTVATAPNLATAATKSKNVGDANVYVYDSNLKNQLYVGSVGDAYVDSILADGKYSIDVDANKGGSALTGVNAPEGVRGMLNTVFMKSVNKTVVDVVVYLPYEFSYSINAKR